MLKPDYTYMYTNNLAKITYWVQEAPCFREPKTLLSEGEAHFACLLITSDILTCIEPSPQELFKKWSK
jgi:hypothetical protein